jgi:hypothetical protein
MSMSNEPMSCCSEGGGEIEILRSNAVSLETVTLTLEYRCKIMRIIRY